MSCQPLIGNADYPQDVYLARGAEHVGQPEVDETAEVGWVPLDEAAAMIASPACWRQPGRQGSACRQ